MSAVRIQGPRPLRRQATLRAQALRGDEGAFTELYRRHHQALYRYSLAIVRNPEDARDVLQNSMTKAFTALQEEKRDFEVLPWLFRIVHNESISQIRRRRPAETLDDQWALGEDTLERSVEARARLTQLQTDLADLGERQRGALVMRELSGLSHEEIGVALGCSTAAAKQAIFEARSSLLALAEGREMDCDLVQRAISDADGRVLRARRIRAHLRACDECSAFRKAIDSRSNDLAAIAPGLPAAAAAAVLAKSLTAAQIGTTSTGAATAGGLLAGGTVGKSIAVVAATGALAGGAVTAERVATSNNEPPPKSAPPASPGQPAAGGAGAGTSGTPRDKDKTTSTDSTTSPGKSGSAGQGKSGAGQSNGKANAKGKSKDRGASKGKGKDKSGKGKGTTKAPGQLKTKTTPAGQTQGRSVGNSPGNP